MGKTPETKPGSRLAKAAAFSGGAAFVLGAAGLAGWLTGWRVLASVRSEYIPMAPDTALLFMAFGVILFSGAYAKGRGIARSLVAAFVGLASVYGALKFAENFIRADLTFEGLLFPVTERLGTFPLGRMSPYAGLIFFACGVALLIRILGRDRANLRNAASFLGMAVLVGGGVAATGYLFGTPLLYGGQTIPLAATTSVAFLFLGLGVTVAAGKETRIMRELSGPSPSARLLRGILPAIVLAILLDGLLDTSLANALNVNKALLSAVLTLAFMALTVIIVVRATRTIFLGAARAEAERLRAEAALRESEIRYRLLAENMKDVVWLLDPETMFFTYVSPSVEALRGYTPEEIVAKPVYDALVPEAQEAMRQLIGSRIAQFLANPGGDHSYTNLVEQPCKDGSTVLTEVVTRFYRDEETGKIQVHGVTRDITERSRAEEALRRSEERFRQVAENEGDFIWEVDANGLYTYANPVVERILGYRPDELIGKVHYYDLFAPDVREEMKAGASAAFARKESFRDFVNPNVRKDGVLVILETSASPIEDEAGNLVGYRGADKDITERKRAEEEIKNAQLLLKSSIESPQEMIILSIDLQYRYLYFNRWHKQVMRAAYGKDVRIGMNLLECVTSEDDRQKAKRNYDRALAGESHSTVEEYGDVERSYYESFYSPIINENGKIIGATAFARDVTNRKRAEEALRDSVKQKELLMKELQHRVKNSLALVSGLLGLGMEAVTDEQARGIISETRSRIRSVASLYEQLYGTSDPASVDLGHYFGRLAEALFKAYAPETGNVLLKTRLDEVKLDTKRAVPLGLILNELVTNTLKYAFPAGAKGEIRVDLESSGGTVTFGVSDDGPGFPDRFDPKTSGGMGWSLVRMLTEEINGELICPAMTKGARVLIRFKP